MPNHADSAPVLDPGITKWLAYEADLVGKSRSMDKRAPWDMRIRNFLLRNKVQPLDMALRVVEETESDFQNGLDVPTVFEMFRTSCRPPAFVCEAIYWFSAVTPTNIRTSPDTSWRNATFRFPARGRVRPATRLLFNFLRYYDCSPHFSLLAYLPECEIRTRTSLSAHEISSALYDMVDKEVIHWSVGERSYDREPVHFIYFHEPEDMA